MEFLIIINFVLFYIYVNWLVELNKTFGATMPWTYIYAPVWGPVTFIGVCYFGVKALKRWGRKNDNEKNKR